MMDDFEIKVEEADLVARFLRNEIGRKLAAEGLSLYRESKNDKERAVALAKALRAAGYIEHVYRRNAYTRNGEMTEWFGLSEVGIVNLAERWSDLSDKWAAQKHIETEAEELALEAAELEQERIDRWEDEGAYGRTVQYIPECDDWIYIRFGRMPKDGRSVFGLAAEDTEDGPDQWKQELGGKTHESGVCVFRAYRHPDVADAYVVLSPIFDLALYGVPDFETYMNAVIPRYEPDEHPSAFRIDGKLVTTTARDRTKRVELGSDGEYMIDTKKPYETQRLHLSSIWISEKQPVVDFLKARRDYDIPDGAPHPVP